MNPTDIANFLATHQWLIAIAIIWTLSWKGAALWKAARNGSKGWFVVLLVINTLGILEIIYIFAFSKTKAAPEPEKVPEPPVETKVEDVKKDN